jgi:hypothetical protein
MVLEFHFTQTLDHTLVFIFKITLVAGVEQMAFGIDEDIAVGLLLG